jgi:hypothetical protein
MIVVNLKGGLGNQMFQYAAGTALASKHGVPLFVDMHSLQSNTNETAHFTPRSAELDVFNLKMLEAPEELLQKFQAVTSTLHYRIRRNISERLVRYRVFRYDSLDFPPLFETLGRYTYLDGFFQSEKFFLENKQSIRNLFTWIDPLDPINSKLAKRIAESQAVSLHVRRGDYLKPTNAALFGNICTLEYYNHAVEEIKSRVNNPTFFIFSDDAQWTREHLQTGSDTVYIDFNTGKNSHMDLRLMSLCKHHIIANSSFSWWGAWLNPSAEKIVIAPSRWLADPAMQAVDVVPSTWIRI